MLYTLRFFSSKYSLFRNANLFCSCIIHILYTGCAKIKKNNSGVKGLRLNNLNGMDMFNEWERGDWQKKLWNGAHQEEENEVDLNLPGLKRLEDWWRKRN